MLLRSDLSRHRLVIVIFELFPDCTSILLLDMFDNDSLGMRMSEGVFQYLVEPAFLGLVEFFVDDDMVGIDHVRKTL